MWYLIFHCFTFNVVTENEANLARGLEWRKFTTSKFTNRNFPKFSSEKQTSFLMDQMSIKVRFVLEGIKKNFCWFKKHFKSKYFRLISFVFNFNRFLEFSSKISNLRTQKSAGRKFEKEGSTFSFGNKF